MLLHRLLWSAIGGMIAVGFALVVGRVPSILPVVKVWLCRLVFVKLFLGLFWCLSFEFSASPSVRVSTSRLPEFLMVIWGIGVFLVASHVWAAVRCARQLRDRSTPVRDSDVNSLARPLSLARVEVRIRNELDGPCVVGVFRPCLVLPRDRGNDRTIVYHELAHVKHRDLLWNAVAWFVYALFWFVPGLGLTFKELSLWNEARADDFARHHAVTTPSEQANKLLGALTRAHAPCTVAKFNGQSQHIARRLRAMFESRRSKSLMTAVLLLSFAFLVPIQAKAPLGDPGRNVGGARPPISKPGPAQQIATLAH